MAYSTGMLSERIKVLNRSAAKTSAFGSGSGGYTWASSGEIWANVTWSKGAKALQEGAYDAYDVIMVRCRYNTILNRNSRIEWDGRLFAIQSFNADKHANTIQITAQELTGMG